MSFPEVLFAFQITTGTEVQQRKNAKSQVSKQVRSIHTYVGKFGQSPVQ